MTNNDLDPKAMQAAYESAMRGVDEPSYMVAPEGAFLKNTDGSVTVFDFDAEGNHYPLSDEEQASRIERLRKRLGIAS